MKTEAKSKGLGRDQVPKGTRSRSFFEVLHQDSVTKARVGKLRTAHGIIDTPCFMPCATQGTVKALSSEDLTGMGAQILLSNVYHLYLRPGKEVFASAGGLHRFMNWTGAILTDSGGFQVFSLAGRRQVREEGVSFQSHVDGAAVFLSPEEVVRFQGLLGSDLLMPLDECVAYPVEKDLARDAMERTVRWAERSKKEFRGRSLLFGIVQGSIYPDLRREACGRLTEIDFGGYAVGGLSVGEPKGLQWESCRVSSENLPQEKPRYLMGVGMPEDLLEAVSFGYDLFDCVLPTRNGRNGQAFTKCGKLNLRNARFAKEEAPLEEGCLCKACRSYSRAYLHHLIRAREILGIHLATAHNLTFYLHLMTQIREAIASNRFVPFKESFLKDYAVREEEDET